MAVYALNLFDIRERDEYLAYARRAPAEVANHGGRAISVGRFRQIVTGDIAARQVLIPVEWTSKEAFHAYRTSPDLDDLHPHREKGSSGYVWHLFDRIDDLGALLK